jgi:phage gpG-like protein
MAAPYDFYDDIKRQLDKLKEQLIDPNKALLGGQKLMKWIGAQGIATSQRAFIDQKLGDINWPARYEGQKNPKFNYAGALMDWKTGRKAPKPNRFSDRPALIDEGMRGGMQGSLTFNVTGPLSVKWGSGKDYAMLHQKGGFTSISWDQATKDRAYDWLYKTKPQKGKVSKPAYRKGSVKVSGARVGYITATHKVPRSAYAEHVHTIFSKGSPWEQRVRPRPFVGIPDQLALDISASIKMYFEKAQK